MFREHSGKDINMASIPSTHLPETAEQYDIQRQQDTLSRYNSLSEKKLLSLEFIDINQKGMETGNACNIDNKK